MDLINSLPHKRNTSVRVNSNTYQIDANGLCRDVADADAAKLLQNDAWRLAGTAPAPKAKKEGGRMKLIGADAPPSEPEETAQALSPGAAEPEVVEAKYGVPGPGEDWPDPTEDMPEEYLRQMADAYEVPHKGNVSKATLVKRIQKAMYADE